MMKRLAIALAALALVGATAPAFADCNPAHASSSQTKSGSKGG
ncbi:hypothetical protein ACLBXM_21560 [Xanthobacteraceae bacterium A53D]